MDVPLTTTAIRLDAAMDRIQEAHFYIHGMEERYHTADPFRWQLNAFLRALKEVPQLISMALQNEPGFPEWFRPRRAELKDDQLVGHLWDQRDFIVHRGMLTPASVAMLGVTDGRSMRLSISMPIDPLVDSDEAMRRVVVAVQQHGGDFLGLLVDDEDTIPAIERSWSLPEFGGSNLLDLCASAWIKVADVLRGAYAWAGVQLDTPALPCRHQSEEIRRVNDG